MDFDDDQVLTILRKEVKQRKETLAEIKDSGREDLVEATQAEIDILQKYLPAELSAEAVKKVVVEIVNAMNPEDRKMGLVMKSVMAKLRGKADGKLISTVVREILAE